MAAADLHARLDREPGTISVYAGRLDAPPTWTRQAEATHYAASTMKLAVLAALHRAAEAGHLDPDAPVEVVNRFTSARPDAPPYSCRRAYDNDGAVWDRLGEQASLRWLAERMIVRSSNLATNLVIEHVGLPAVAQVWQRAGARNSVTGRGIEDFAAREAQITNLVTAADLAALLGAVATGATRPGPIASPAGCTAMLDVLCAQQIRQDIAEGVPAGVRLAHKNGWVRGVRHGAAVVYPADAEAYLLVVCTTVGDDQTDARADVDANQLVADISREVWQARHDLGTLTPAGSPAAPPPSPR
ncbi:serine hydrolase [Verrucosispora sp. CWR15]|uniref:Serine hydrolase n=1 Tax=Verrucosispora sioxanthis TaxID=2499994 RepID=A0A6M1L877_9ACTN|nr:serine hydrolase [Verrucosispora sioxanthis]NEE65337.1 serine hydrolase [Verrucosispora sioxanthis]NGM14447.1 serine hydrolase [Verrucosispora sioxanthis]